MMNLMGYDAMTIGNHEFDFGLENMAELFRMADFPVVCSNYDVTGTVLEGLVKPYITLVREGVKIGIFGLAPKMEGLVQADKCVGIVYNDPIKVAQEMTDLLREKENCEVVICMSHLGIRSANPEGASDENLVGKTRGIDVIWEDIRILLWKACRLSECGRQERSRAAHRKEWHLRRRNGTYFN